MYERPVGRPVVLTEIAMCSFFRTTSFRTTSSRHTGATLALEAGANPVLVAFWLGRTSTRMLEQHYAGRLDRADRPLACALDAAARLRHADSQNDAPDEQHPS